MIPFLILDTGCIVAALSPNDNFHLWALEKLKEASGALITCEPVLTEAAFFLSKSPKGIRVLLDFIDAAPIQLPFSYSQNRVIIRKLLLQYSDVPMSFADACLVRLSELYPDAPLITLDRDFLIYRRNKNEPIPAVLLTGKMLL